jgi:hypothetical protein
MAMPTWDQSWNFIQSFLRLPGKEDWPVIRRAISRTWTLLVVAAVACFLAGVAWANRTNADPVADWRLSNYALRQKALDVATHLRMVHFNRDREMKVSHASEAEELINLKIDYAQSSRMVCVQLKNVLEERLRTEDRIKRSQQLSALYMNPQRFEDLDRLADDLEWMARKIPRHTPPFLWLEARFWLWD